MTSPNESWRPAVFDESDDVQMSAASAILRDPNVEVTDTLAAQRQELARRRGPAGEESVDEPARWVYYPWRRRIVRLLGPKSFARVRLDRNRNKITAEEQTRLAHLKVVVIGLSVGHVISHTLALEGLCGELRLADFDTIELSNLNRIPGTVFDLGANKAVVAARRIAEIDPYLSVQIYPSGVDTSNLDEIFDGVDIVIEECDSLDVKLAVREAARERKIPVIMETSDRGLIDVERFDLDPAAAPFHGLLGDVNSADLAQLQTRDKVPHVLRILEAQNLSPRMAASMAEIDATVTTWPQLGGDVTLGAATAAAAVRRIGRGEQLASGRARIDLEASLDRIAVPRAEPVLTAPTPIVVEDVPADFAHVIASAAALAPSGGNAQPWRFEADEVFRIVLAPERTSSMDVDFRGSYVAIGAAMFNARVAAAAQGQLTDVVLFPDPRRQHLVAELRFHPGVDVDLVDLHGSLRDRCTNRNLGNQKPLPAEVASVFSHEAEREGGHARMITERAAIVECAELLGESDRLRFLSPVLHQEMMSELRWPGRDSLEMGIDVRSLALDDSDLAKLEVARRRDVMDYLDRWDGGRALGDITRERVNSSSAILVVTTSGSTPSAFVQGGAALERVWLAASRAGVALQPVSPVTIYAISEPDYLGLAPTKRVDEFRGLSNRFRQLVQLSPGESMVLMLRASYASEPQVRSERLPLSSVLSVTSESAARL